MSLIVQGEHVWLDDRTVPGGFGLPIGARVESIEGSKVVLQDDEGRVSRTCYKLCTVNQSLRIIKQLIIG